MMYRVTDGNVYCWVKAKDKQKAIDLANQVDYFGDEDGPHRLSALALNRDTLFSLDIGHDKIEHTIQDWNGIFEGFEDRVIAFSEY